MAKAVRGALEKVPAMPEWQDAAFLKRARIGIFNEALSAAHAPVHEADLSPDTRRRASGWPMTNCWPISWRCS